MSSSRASCSFYYSIFLQCPCSIPTGRVRAYTLKGSNRDTAMFAMVNSDWRDKAKEALRKLLEPEDGTKLRRAKAKAKAAVMAAKTKAATENSTTGRDPATAASKAGATGAEADHYKSKSKDA